MRILNPMTPIGAMVRDPLTLAFRGRHRYLEEEFAAQYFENNLSHRRLCHWLTILILQHAGPIGRYLLPGHENPVVDDSLPRGLSCFSYRVRLQLHICLPPLVAMVIDGD